MPHYMLDTNIASLIIKGRDPDILSKVINLPLGSVVVSVVTEAELIFGVRKRAHAALEARVMAFLQQVEVLTWDSQAAHSYADLRCHCERNGIGLAPMDMLIAAHAIAVGAVLVSRDKAFAKVMTNLETWEAP